VDDAFLISWSERNLRRHLTGVAARMPGASVLEHAGCTLVDSGLPSDALNVVCGARRHLLTSDDVRWVLSHYLDRQLPFTWWVGPTGLWAGDVLYQHGLALTAIEMGMAGELDQLELPSPGAWDLRRATSPEEVVDHARVLEVATTPPDETLPVFFEQAAGVILRPSTDRHLFLLYEDGIPLSTAELCVSEHIVGLYGVATRPGARGRGLATAVLADALRFARDELHAETVVLQSNARARPLYRRLELRPIGEFHEFTPEARDAEWAG